MTAQVHGVLGPVELLPGGQESPRRLAVRVPGPTRCSRQWPKRQWPGCGSPPCPGDHHQVLTNTLPGGRKSIRVLCASPPGLPGHLPDRGRRRGHRSTGSARRTGRTTSTGCPGHCAGDHRTGFQRTDPRRAASRHRSGFPAKGLQVAAKQVRAVVENPSSQSWNSAPLSRRTWTPAGCRAWVNLSTASDRSSSAMSRSIRARACPVGACGPGTCGTAPAGCGAPRRARDCGSPRCP